MTWGTTVWFVLLGRTRECGVAERALDDARACRGGVLLVTGEAGVGKTAVLDYVIDHARGLNVLRCRGVESEAEVAFGGLLDLCRPLLDRIDDLPGRQADALRGALGLGATQAPDRFLLGAATLSLLAAAANDRPIAVVIDDAQWLDRASLQAVLFAGRRLHADPILVVAAFRGDRPADISDTEFVEMRLGGLEFEDSVTFMGSIAVEAPRRRVSLLLHAGTAGNPLALSELACQLSVEQLRGATPLPDPLPVGPGLVAAFGLQIKNLGEAGRLVLLIAAATPSAAFSTVAAAASSWDPDGTALQLAMDRDLVRIVDGQLQFRHPLIRSAAYASSTETERGAAHRLLAAALREGPLREERTWHLAKALTHADDSVAFELDEVGTDLLGRGGYAGASAAFERAASLTVTGSDKLRRLLGAADAAQLAGLTERALALIREALRYAERPAQMSHLLRLRGHIEHLAGQPAAALRTLQAAARTGDVSPTSAVEILVEACEAAAWSLDTAGYALAVQGFGSLSFPAGSAEDFLTTMLSGVSAMTSGRLADGHLLLVRADELGAKIGQDGMDPRYAVWRAVAAYHLGHYGRAATLAEKTLTGIQDAGAVGALPYLLSFAAEVDLRRGRWLQAYAAAGEAVTLARECGQLIPLCVGLSILASIRAARGDFAGATVCASEAALRAADSQLLLAGCYAAQATAFVHLSRDRPEDAITPLREINRLFGERDFHAPILDPTADLLAAHLATGDIELARALECRLTPFTVDQDAIRLRSKALLAEDSGYDLLFQQAIELHNQGESPFEKARTQLCFGRRLRHEGRRRDARPVLRASLAGFEGLTATAWIDKANHELRATGERNTRHTSNPATKLTPQETRIATLAAEGMSNREIAAAIFLSPKTVEFHLGGVYRKLAISRRVELIHHMTGAASPSHAASADRRP